MKPRYRSTSSRSRPTPKKSSSSASMPTTCSSFWDWVGGRYSMGSAVGLSIMLAIGADQFRAMLAGFRAMDEHFRTAPPARNLPWLHGLLAIWNNNFLGASTTAVLPYEQYLKRFPAYLQQLMMESNGKRVTRRWRRRRLPDRAGSLGRAWHQRPAFVLPAASPGNAFRGVRLHRLLPHRNPLGDQHDLLMANLFAQSEALAFGKTPDQVGAEGDVLTRWCRTARSRAISRATRFLRER